MVTRSSGEGSIRGILVNWPSVLWEVAEFVGGQVSMYTFTCTVGMDSNLLRHTNYLSPHACICCCD